MFFVVRFFPYLIALAICLPLITACDDPENELTDPENGETIAEEPEKEEGLVAAEPEKEEVLVAEEPEPEPPATPSLVVELSLKELIDLSDYIAAGTVTNIESRWNEDQTRIYTFNKLEVQEYLKGSDDNEIIIKVPGGRVGSEEHWVEDTPIFMEGEEVIVFLERDDDGTFNVVGGFQGVYRTRNEGLIENGLSLPELIEHIKSKINRK